MSPAGTIVDDVWAVRAAAVIPVTSLVVFFSNSAASSLAEAVPSGPEGVRGPGTAIGTVLPVPCNTGNSGLLKFVLMGPVTVGAEENVVLPGIGAGFDPTPCLAPVALVTMVVTGVAVTITIPDNMDIGPPATELNA